MISNTVIIAPDRVKGDYVMGEYPQRHLITPLVDLANNSLSPYCGELFSNVNGIMSTVNLCYNKNTIELCTFSCVH